MRNLLPCKYCGHHHPKVVYHDGIDEFASVEEALDLGALEEDIGFQIRCPECGTSGPVVTTEGSAQRDAVSGWNNLMM